MVPPRLRPPPSAPRRPGRADGARLSRGRRRSARRRV